MEEKGIDAIEAREYQWEAEMSLLQVERTPEFQRLTDEVYRRQLESDARLNQDLSETAKKKMYQDVEYNVDFLHTALVLEDDQIYGEYARWLYQLLCSLMTYYSRELVRDLMVQHFSVVRECMEQSVPGDKQPKLHSLIDCAIEATIDECQKCKNQSDSASKQSKYEAEIEAYLEHLKNSDTRGAIGLVSGYEKRGIPLRDIYVDIIGEAMRRVGDLWQKHQISVDTEHYCTTVTQLALAQMYPVVFGQARKDRCVLVACVGSELHEMGARMVADLFEYDGWDSIYLGAAVPIETICAQVEACNPQLIALSVTMPQHLALCREEVAKIRKLCPDVKIAVGGHAFAGTNEIWKNWRVDVYTQDARELVKWADDTFG